MKKIFFFILFFLLGNSVLFPQVAINTNGSQPDPSAGLDVNFDNKGFLPPRMTQTQRDAINSPAEGLMIICTDCGYSNPVVLSIFINGIWRLLTGYCSVPVSTIAGTHIANQTQITWNWNAVIGAIGYKWGTANNIATAADIGMSTSKTETELTCNSLYTRYIWAYNDCGFSPVTITMQSTRDSSISAPTAGAHVSGMTQIIWNWNTVPGAIGYRWNTTNDYGSSVEMGTTTTKTETELTCGISYTRYIWAYWACGTSTPATLCQTTLACQVCGDPFIDIRDGKTYNTVLIGTQCWMKENLNTGTRIDGSQEQTNNFIIEKYCFNDDEENCNAYGGLYQWDELMDYTTSSNDDPGGRPGICPAGWHVPSDTEWCQMETYIDSTVICNDTGWLGNDAGGKMKESGTDHWASPNTGATNESGFTALPGGFRHSSGFFYGIQTNNLLWSASESSNGIPWRLNLTSDHAQIGRDRFDEKNIGFSGRCVRD